MTERPSSQTVTTSWPARVVRAPFLGLIVVYQRVISPWTASSCRYYPSCSAYAYQAIATHGVLKGCWLALRRLLRCHPWAAGGVDHVPPRAVRGAEAQVPGPVDVPPDPERANRSSAARGA